MVGLHLRAVVLGLLFLCLDSYAAPPAERGRKPSPTPSATLVAASGPQLQPVVVIRQDSKEFAPLARTMRINDFPMDRNEMHYCSGEEGIAGCAAYLWIHPYWLRAGENSVGIDYYAPGERTDPGTRFKATFHFHEGQRADGALEQPKVGKEIFTLSTPKFPFFDEEHKRHLTAAFDWKGAIPHWAWTRGNRVTPSWELQFKLYGAYQKIWSSIYALAPGSKSELSPEQAQKFETESRESAREYLQASQLGNYPDPFAEMLAHAKKLNHQGVTLTMRGLPAFGATTLQVFAGGRLARLVNAGAALIRFQGGVRGAPVGSPYPIDLAYDLWFRRTSQGAWELDAIVPER